MSALGVFLFVGTTGADKRAWLALCGHAHSGMETDDTERYTVTRHLHSKHYKTGGDPP
jgi:hypothetical protein